MPTYRPLFHFSPPQGWMNDPNGLVYYKGLWHLFYQAVPHQIHWGPTHWGHAVSRDLAHWEHWPIALSPDELGAIFSGSAAINLREDGSEELVACFTHCNEQGTQVQSLAFSHDEGLTWQKYENNPVLTSDRAGFRDPKIFRFQDRWIMAVSGDSECCFYASPNLTDWTLLSTIPAPHQGWVWECPDLLEVGGEWLLIASFVAPNRANFGHSGTHGWIGRFDGTRFTPRTEMRASSFAPDDYATGSWNNAPDNRVIVIGWMSHLAYSDNTPTADENFRGAMTLPRELSIQNDKLYQLPPQELETLRGEAIPFDQNNITFEGEAYELEAEIDISNLQGEVGFHLRVGPDEVTRVIYNREQGLSIDRKLSGQSDFHDEFAAIFSAPLEVQDVLKLRVFVDRCSVEVFAQDGALYGAALIFPGETSRGIEFVGIGARITHGAIYPING